MLISAALSFTSPVGLIGGSASYVLSGRCPTEVPNPVTSPIALPMSFVDVPNDEGGLNGTCTNFSDSSGAFSGGTCMTGVARGTAQLTEPNAETATISSYAMVFAGGLGIVVASPHTVSPVASPGGYTDDGSTGTMIGIARITPNPLLSCVTGVTDYSMQAILLGEYGTAT